MKSKIIIPTENLRCFREFSPKDYNQNIFSTTEEKFENELYYHVLAALMNDNEIDEKIFKLVSLDFERNTAWQKHFFHRIAAHYDDDHLKVENITIEVTSEREPSEPAAVVYLLELLCSTSNRDAIVGDLLEQNQEAVELYGPVRARILLWRRAMGSIASLAWGACRRFAFVAIFFQVVDWFRKLSI